MSRRIVRASFCVLTVFATACGSHAAQQVPPSAPVTQYAIHADGGLIYDPLRREAEATGQLRRYEGVPSRAFEVSLGEYHLRGTLPQRARGYDVVPITYSLERSTATDATMQAADVTTGIPVAVEAVAFEDEGRRAGRDLHDLALPGHINLNVEYLGAVTAHLIPGARHNLSPDHSDQPGSYPGFERKPLTRSGIVEAGDLVWFKFRYTNTGNTILDPEGFGGCQLWPQLFRKDESGEYQAIGQPYNLYVRDLEYLYPGESQEKWIHFQTTTPDTPQRFGLIPGEYKIQFRLVYRCYKDASPFTNLWDGPPAFIWEMPIKVEAEPRNAPMEPGHVLLTNGGEPDKLTRFIHTFEEFMTAFDCYQRLPKNGGNPVSGTLHLQVAPWTQHVVIKLIHGGDMGISSVAIPIDVSNDHLTIDYTPRPATCFIQDDKLIPIIMSQSMADMRANVQLGPFPERHIRERLREMMNCGINCVSLTSMPWLYDDKNQPPSNYQGDAMKYFIDCAREAGLWIEGWGAYPFDRASIRDIASWITGRTLDMAVYQTDGYPAVSHCDPLLPEANATAWLYQFERWGDRYVQTADGHVPISVEDTRGWLRQDLNVRFPIGDLSRQAFRKWLRSRYETIQELNAAWGSSYRGFDEIDPEANQVLNEFDHRWEYTDKTNVFHDWSRAVADFDRFRTELRVQNYRDTLERVRETIPTAGICIRTEGANVLVDGIDPSDPNPHLRHIYLSQRRCGLIADIIQDSGLVVAHSDYTTIPFTPSELRRLTQQAVRQGITPSYLPQFDNMRDIAVNSHYGTDYQVHYNLPAPAKGYMMHVLTALYPWFEATIEAGGIPGILWEDYQCDGFATVTQKREMRLFKQALNRAVARQPPATMRAPQVDTAWRSQSKALRSYRTPSNSSTSN
jgi:hypothetical protein